MRPSHACRFRVKANITQSWTESALLQVSAPSHPSRKRFGQMQWRLREIVEGRSMIAIGDYGVGLFGYALKGVESGGLSIAATIGKAISAPFIVGFTWLLQRIKRRVAGTK
jgi:uncharacterized membrane-anchored protein